MGCEKISIPLMSKVAGSVRSSHFLFTAFFLRSETISQPWTIQPLKNHKAVSTLKVSNLPEEFSEDANFSQPIDELKSLGSEMQKKYDLDRIVNIGFIALIVTALAFHASTLNMDTRGWTLAETALQIPSNIWNEYQTVLKSDPIATKAVTSGTGESIPFLYHIAHFAPTYIFQAHKSL